MGVGLPAGHEDILSNPYNPESFSCEGQDYGYYADVESGCEIFHICLPIQDNDGIVTSSPLSVTSLTTLSPVKSPPASMARLGMVRCWRITERASQVTFLTSSQNAELQCGRERGKEPWGAMFHYLINPSIDFEIFRLFDRSPYQCVQESERRSAVIHLYNYTPQHDTLFVLFIYLHYA